MFSFVKKQAPFRAMYWMALLVLTTSCVRRENRKEPSLPATATATQNISHTLIGKWTMPIDGRGGFIREFRPDGTAKVRWPDGKLAALGFFFVVDTNTIGVQFSNRDTEVVHLMDTNTVQIDHVESTGHRKFYARRQP